MKQLSERMQKLCAIFENAGEGCTTIPEMDMSGIVAIAEHLDAEHENELTTLREQVATLTAECRKLAYEGISVAAQLYAREAELAEARKDSERLDWLQSQQRGLWIGSNYEYDIQNNKIVGRKTIFAGWVVSDSDDGATYYESTREAIDAAIKESEIK